MDLDKPMSTFGKELIESLNEAKAHAGGASAEARVHIIEVPDLRAIRQRLGMSQQEFSNAYSIPLATIIKTGNKAAASQTRQRWHVYK